MKGKHGAEAERRRELAALKARAETAEHRAERLQSELDATLARLDLTESGLRAEVRSLTKERDAATSQALRAAIDEANHWRSKSAEDKAAAVAFEHHYRRLMFRYVKRLANNDENVALMTAEANRVDLEIRGELSSANDAGAFLPIFRFDPKGNVAAAR